MPILELTPRERAALRADAHPLRPVVLIGDRGLTDAVLKEIDGGLNAHRLIKVRVSGDDRDTREQMLQTICETLSCAPVHHLGKMLILYRPAADAVPADLGRATRKPSAPHVPKKQAAEGRTTPARRTAPRKPPVDVPAPRAAVGLGRAAIPRRSGSALSLRAGARGGLRTGSLRRTAAPRKPSGGR